MKILDLLNALRTLIRIPPIDDEAGLREFFRRLIEVGQHLAAYTPTPLDDSALRVFWAVINNDDLWRAFYAFLKFAATADQQNLLVAAGISLAQLEELREAFHDLA